MRRQSAASTSLRHSAGLRDQRWARPAPTGINNQADRFSLAIDAIDRVGKLQRVGAHAKEEFRDRQLACRRHAYEYGVDSPEICGWTWLCDKSEVRSS